MLPSDPMMLFSFINMKLRDQYPSLDELCRAEDIDEVWLRDKLHHFGFEYSPEHNKFW
jgi:Zn-dependent M32 family carboxypeptidase